jgi:hypothetical protein
MGRNPTQPVERREHLESLSFEGFREQPIREYAIGLYGLSPVSRRTGGERGGNPGCCRARREHLE